MLQRYVVVVGRDDGFPADFCAQLTEQHSADLFRNGLSGCISVTSRAGGIVNVLGTRLRVCVEDTKPVADGFRT
jgi:hypothetical protein